MFRDASPRAALLNPRLRAGERAGGGTAGQDVAVLRDHVVAERRDDRERRRREQISGEPEADPRLAPEDRRERESAGVRVPGGQKPGEVGDILPGQAHRIQVAPLPWHGVGRPWQPLPQAVHPGGAERAIAVEHQDRQVAAEKEGVRPPSNATPGVPHCRPNRSTPPVGEIARTTDSAHDSCVRRKDPDDSFPPCNDWLWGICQALTPVLGSQVSVRCRDDSCAPPHSAQEEHCESRESQQPRGAWPSPVLSCSAGARPKVGIRLRAPPRSLRRTALSRRTR